MNNIVVQSDVLPMLPGYAIGNIIKKDTVNLVLWKKRSLMLEEKIRQVEAEKTEVEKSKGYINADQDLKREIIANVDKKILNLMAECKQILTKVAALQEKEDFSMEEMLPMDAAYSKMRVENRSFASEKLDHMIFIQGKNKPEDIPSQLETFAAQIFSPDNLSNYLSTTTITEIATKITRLLQTEQQISLVGSFITLPQVRLIDPIVLRKNAFLSEQLKTKSKDYYVLTEAVLGGVFIGFGRHISKTQVKDQSEIKEETPQLMSRLATISFISQGAIPRVNDDPENVNMWNVYVSWKELLRNDRYCGYPIGFKWKELQDVLSENGIHKQ